MKIFYVHHTLREKGNPPSQDDDLYDLGREEALVVAKSLLLAKNNGRTFKAIYTSPYYRCSETAKIINQFIQVPIIEDERLNEIKSIYHAKRYGLSLDDTETFEELQRRIISALKDIVASHDDNDEVICVTSGVNLTGFICVAYQIKPSDDLPWPQVSGCAPIGFEINKSSFDFLEN